jgi:hypothetical protein
VQYVCAENADATILPLGGADTILEELVLNRHALCQICQSVQSLIGSIGDKKDKRNERFALEILYGPMMDWSESLVLSIR